MDNKEKIISVLEGKENNVSLDLASAMEINKILTQEGLVLIESESNGWQHDFWLQYFRESDEKMFMFTGGWWDGTSNFSIAEE